MTDHQLISFGNANADWSVVAVFIIADHSIVFYQWTRSGNFKNENLSTSVENWTSIICG